MGFPKRFAQVTKLYGDLGATVSEKVASIQLSYGTGIRADANIDANEQLISIPKKLFFSTERILKLHPDWSDFRKNFKSSFSLLALFIARVKSGADSAAMDKKKVFDEAEYLYLRFVVLCSASQFPSSPSFLLSSPFSCETCANRSPFSYLPDKCINGYTFHQKAVPIMPKRMKDYLGTLVQSFCFPLFLTSLSFLAEERSIAAKDFGYGRFRYSREDLKVIGVDQPQFFQAMCLVSSRFPIIFFFYEFLLLSPVNTVSSFADG